MSRYSWTTTRTYTRTNAQYVSSKIAADLRRILSYYGEPSESWIEKYRDELTMMLAESYVDSIEYGFKRNESRVVTLFYSFRSDGTLKDDRAGGVYSRANIDGAVWFSFLIYLSKWNSLTQAERDSFESKCPIKRTTGSQPKDGNGYWAQDRSYSSDALDAQRKTFRPY